MKFANDNEDISNYKSRDEIKLICYNCTEIFTKKKNEIMRVLSGDSSRACKFCSPKCAGHFKSKSKTVQCQCKNCGRPVSKKLSQYKKFKNTFCNHSCAATFNNTGVCKNPIGNNGDVFYKRTYATQCAGCNNKIKNCKSGLCKKCFSKKEIDSFGNRKIADFSSTFARHKYQKIRHHAHRVAKFYKLEKRCMVCTYGNHVELCHIIPIAKFNKDTLLSVVNSPDNLVFLCPNHHWDLDHGKLDSNLLSDTQNS